MKSPDYFAAILLTDTKTCDICLKVRRVQICSLTYLLTKTHTSKQYRLHNRLQLSLAKVMTQYHLFKKIRKK